MTEPMPSMKTLVEAFEHVGALETPLKQRLEALAYWHRELNPALAEAYDRMIERLMSVQSGADAPDVGSPMPPFVLPDHDGSLVSLDQLLENGPAVISFNRGHWCTYCKMEMHTLAQFETQLKQLNARTVSIVPDKEVFSSKFREIANLPFTILTDIDCGYALDLGLVVWLGEEIKALYERHKIDLNEYQGNDNWLVPIPATFVVDQDKQIKARFVDPNFRRRMEVENILTALKETSA